MSYHNTALHHGSLSKQVVVTIVDNTQPCVLVCAVVVTCTLSGWKEDSDKPWGNYMYRLGESAEVHGRREGSGRRVEGVGSWRGVSDTDGEGEECGFKAWVAERLRLGGKQTLPLHAAFPVGAAHRFVDEWSLLCLTKLFEVFCSEYLCHSQAVAVLAALNRNIC